MNGSKKAPMSKNTLIEKIIEISKMGAVELEHFSKKVSLSEVDEKARGFLLRAIRERERFLIEDNKHGVLVERSEVKEGDIE